MSQLLDYTKKMTKNREKIPKIFLTTMKTIIFNENNNFIICGTINIYYIIYLHVLSASGFLFLNK